MCFFVCLRGSISEWSVVPVFKQLWGLKALFGQCFEAMEAETTRAMKSSEKQFAKLTDVTWLHSEFVRF